MSALLYGFKIALLITSGFEQSEMVKPKEALEKAGAIVHIISPEKNMVTGWHCEIPKLGDSFKVDILLDDAKSQDYDALLIPGGYGSPEELRLNKKAIAFVRGFSNKPIAAICHGPSLLIDADLIRSKKVTSYQAIKKDIENAGGKWIDQEVVIDGNLITSRSPDDLPAFNKAIIEVFSKYKRTI